jgi:biotin carboxylase
MRGKISTKHNFFISIGAGSNQIPLIHEAKVSGFSVIGIDQNPAAPGLLLCDIPIYESIEDYYSIYQKLKGLIDIGDIKGVLSRSFGPAIKTVSFIAEQCGISIIPFDRTDDFIDKSKMKMHFHEIGVPTPDFQVIDGLSVQAIESEFLPCVIKPVTGHAKRGVQLLRNRSELEQCIPSPQAGERFLVEQFLAGDEIIAIGIVHRKRYHLIGITDKIKTPPPYFVDIMHIAPSRYDHLKESVRVLGQRICEGFEISTSPLIMELIVDQHNNLSLIEAVPEFGGEFLSDTLIPAATRYNFFGEMVNAVAGLPFTPPKAKVRRAVVVRYITGKRGTLASYSPPPAGEKGILLSKIFKPIGTQTDRPVSNHDRIGVIITSARSRARALRRAERALMNLNIQIIDGNNA